MMHTIRNMKPEEIQKVSAMLKRSYEFLGKQEGLTDEECAALFEQRGSPSALLAQMKEYSFYVVVREGILAGVLAMLENEITKLFVDPSLHTSGIGSALFQIAQRTAAREGFDALVVGTTGFAIPFYESMGMEIYGTTKADEGPLAGRTITLLRKHLMGSNTTRKFVSGKNVHL